MTLSLTCLTALILLIWFKTNAFVEYAKLLHVTKFIKVDEYELLVNDGADITFPDFLKEFHNNFITRLLSCPICTSVWLGLLSAVNTGFMFPVVTLFGLGLYLIISKLL